MHTHTTKLGNLLINRATAKPRGLEIGKRQACKKNGWRKVNNCIALYLPNRLNSSGKKNNLVFCSNMDVQASD